MKMVLYIRGKRYKVNLGGNTYKILVPQKSN